MILLTSASRVARIILCESLHLTCIFFFRQGLTM
jgi:hypothetical protein